MKRELQFLTGYISKEVLESKLERIENAFLYDDCFDEVTNESGIYIMMAKKVVLYTPKRNLPFFT